MLDFSLLKFDNLSPIYQQIVRYVKENIVLGTVADREELPSRRLLSGMLGINPNTIQKAYRCMEEEGLIVSYAGSGSCLSFNSETAERMKQELLEYETKIYVERLKRMGISLTETQSQIAVHWNREQQETGWQTE